MSFLCLNKRGVKRPSTKTMQLQNPHKVKVIPAWTWVIFCDRTPPSLKQSQVFYFIESMCVREAEECFADFSEEDCSYTVVHSADLAPSTYEIAKVAYALLLVDILHKLAGDECQACKHNVMEPEAHVECANMDYGSLLMTYGVKARYYVRRQDLMKLVQEVVNRIDLRAEDVQSASDIAQVYTTDMDIQAILEGHTDRIKTLKGIPDMVESCKRLVEDVIKTM